MSTPDVQERLARLSPEKRALLLAALREKAARAEQSHMIPRRAPGDPVPLSFGQQRLWFADQVDTGGSSYNVAVGLRLTGHLDVAALGRSLNEIVRRHEALRTTFPMFPPMSPTTGGGPVQVVAPSLDLTLPVVDLEPLAAEEREEAARRLAGAEAQRRFDLAEGPLLAARLLRLGAEDHLLVLTMHHIVSDGWSLGVLFRELAALHEETEPVLSEAKEDGRQETGEPKGLAPLPIQYADFAAWQRQQLQGATLDTQLGYWRQHLAGAPTTLDLPTDRPRPSVQSYRGTVATFEFAPTLSTRLTLLSRQCDSTLFMVLLAAFGTLLFRSTGQDDLLIGSPIANRTRPETEGLIGFFVNTLALRTDLSGDPTFRELLGRVREATLGAYAHQDLPFERLVEAVQPERDLSRHPLFQIMFALQNAPMEPPRLPGLTARLVDLDSVTSPFDLTLLLEETDGGLHGLLEYATDLFDGPTMTRLIGHFETLLTAIVDDPDRRLSELPLLTPAERQQLADWNDTGSPYPADRCLHELIEAQVERTPEAIAVRFGSTELSYRELNARANQLAHYLRRRGVGPEVRVGICVERSIEQMVGLLGILKAGGAYVPLDPAYPADRLAYMLEDAGVPVLLTQEHLLGRLPAHAAQAFCLDTGWDLVGPNCTANSTANPSSATTPENAAYVIYTSGSTGRPKGVVVPHRGLVNHSIAIGRLYELGPSDRVLQFASMSFDVMAEELYPTWVNGATLVLRPDDVATSFSCLLELVERERLTVLNLPIPYWHEWVAELARTGEPLPAPLRLVVSGSEKALADRFALWQRTVGDRVRWMNAYGPTEATITTTTYEPTECLGRASVPIGRPIGNTQVYVLDPTGQQVPIGVPGELFIGGENVARGYLGRPDLTAERFAPDPFSAVPGARLYRTGDRVCLLADGAVEFLGRFDFQVKLRGFRIELGEIEAALTSHPAVRDGLVAVRDDGPTGPYLAAYVVPGDPALATADRLRAHLEQRLPSYMVPTAFVMLDALPLSPSGKLDRRALPAPSAAHRGLDAAFVAPATELEQTVAAIWQDVLGLPRVGRRDNFFDLGGHSLLLARVHAELRRQLGTDLTLIDLFKHPTVGALAEALTASASTPDSDPLPGIQDRAASRREMIGRQRQLRQQLRG